MYLLKISDVKAFRKLGGHLCDIKENILQMRYRLVPVVKYIYIYVTAFKQNVIEMVGWNSITNIARFVLKTFHLFRLVLS